MGCTLAFDQLCLRAGPPLPLAAMSDGRTRHTKRCTSHGGRSLNLVAHDLGAVEAAGECGELKGHKVLTDPRREGVEPSFSSLDYGTDRARHPFDRSVVFRRCRKTEEGAAILPSETTLIVQSALMSNRSTTGAGGMPSGVAINAVSGSPTLSRPPARRWKTSPRSTSCARQRDGNAAGVTPFRTIWPCSIPALILPGLTRRRKSKPSATHIIRWRRPG